MFKTLSTNCFSSLPTIFAPKKLANFKKQRRRRRRKQNEKNIYQTKHENNALLAASVWEFSISQKSARLNHRVWLISAGCSSALSIVSYFYSSWRARVSLSKNQHPSFPASSSSSSVMMHTEPGPGHRSQVVAHGSPRDQPSSRVESKSSQHPRSSFWGENSGKETKKKPESYLKWGRASREEADSHLVKQTSCLSSRQSSSKQACDPKSETRS